MINLRISSASTSPRSECDIRLNYADPRKIIAASNDLNSPTQAQFYSCDSGCCWGQTNLPAVPGDTFQSDPAVDWTSDGIAWAATIGVSGVSSVRTFTSPDSGENWTFEATPSGGQTAADREIMWVDHSPASPYKDQVYLMWHNGTPVFFARRTPGFSGTWQAPVQVSGPETTVVGIGGDIKTNSFGDVFVFWPDADGSRNIVVVKSTDGGVTFGAPIIIASTFATTRRLSIPATTFPGRNARVYISAGAYRTATKNLVYAVWSDLNGQVGCSSGGGPGTNVSSPCKTRVWFSRSVDGGNTWSAPVMLNNQSSLNDQFHSRLCVDESYGNLIVTYHDTVNDPTRLQSDIWMQTSTDDGQTWSTPIKVTSARTDETTAGANSFQYGDYDGLDGFYGTFFPVWTDRRSGGREEIWTAKIQVPIPITQIRAHIETGDKDPNRNAIIHLGFDGKHGREFRMRTSDDSNPFRENTVRDIVFGSGANVRDQNINDPTDPSMDLTQITGAYIRIEPRREESWEISTALVFINGSTTPAFSLKLPNIVMEEDATEKVSLG
jgi:hypothetical protein